MTYSGAQTFLQVLIVPAREVLFIWAQGSSLIMFASLAAADKQIICGMQNVTSVLEAYSTTHQAEVQHLKSEKLQLEERTQALAQQALNLTHELQKKSPSQATGMLLNRMYCLQSPTSQTLLACLV